MPINRIRIFLGGVLLVAAAFKVDTLPAPPRSLPWSLATALVFAELILAGFLFSGALPRCTWWATTLCFSCFTLIAGVKTWSGEADCGCFGSIATPPWAAAVLDISAVGALLFKYHERGAPQQTTAARATAASNWTQLPMAVGFALIVVVGMRAVISISSVQPTLAAVDPTRWVGQRWPLLDDIDIGEELSSGVWTVILHRQGCAKCADLLSGLKPIADQPGSRIALVELPPATTKADNAQFANGMLLGRLHGREFTALPSPLVLQVIEGRVVFADDQSPPGEKELAPANGSHSIQHRTAAFEGRVK